MSIVRPRRTAYRASSAAFQIARHHARAVMLAASVIVALCAFRVAAAADTRIPPNRIKARRSASVIQQATRTDSVSVKLLIWAKRPGTMSGAKMQIAVNGKARGSISNLDEQMLTTLGSFAPGIHSYSLTGITGYSVDATGAVQRATEGSGTCSGQFVVQPFQTYYFLMVGTQDGRTFQCQIQ